MNCLRAETLLQDIDKAMKDIRSFEYTSALEKSYLAKFLVVFICGLYEEIIETIISEKVEKLRSLQVSNFVTKYFEDYFRNPCFDKVIELLGKFDPAWANELSKIQKILKLALDSIVSNKNAIAHGLNSGITLVQVEEYYYNSRKLIEKIDEIVLSN